MPVQQAITQLEFTHKKAAGMVIKLLRSAVANAENNLSLKPETLYIKSLTCDMGPTLKRYFPRARGSAFVIQRKMSHVNVVLEQRPAKKGQSSSKFSFSKRSRKLEVKPSAMPGAPESTTERPDRQEAQKQPQSTRVIKPSEERKANVVRQKRRLFTRKTGE